MNCLHFYKKSAIRKVLLGHSVNFGKFSEFFLDANLRDGESIKLYLGHLTKIKFMKWLLKERSDLSLDHQQMFYRGLYLMRMSATDWAPSEDCDDLVWAWLRHQGKQEPWQKLCKCCASQVNKRNRRIVNKRTDISIKLIPFFVHKWP